MYFQSTKTTAERSNIRSKVFTAQYQRFKQQLITYALKNQISQQKMLCVKFFGN